MQNEVVKAGHDLGCQPSAANQSRTVQASSSREYKIAKKSIRFAVESRGPHHLVVSYVMKCEAHRQLGDEAGRWLPSGTAEALIRKWGWHERKAILMVQAFAAGELSQTELFTNDSG